MSFKKVNLSTFNISRDDAAPGPGYNEQLRGHIFALWKLYLVQPNLSMAYQLRHSTFLSQHFFFLI